MNNSLIYRKEAWYDLLSVWRTPGSGPVGLETWLHRSASGVFPSMCLIPCAVGSVRVSSCFFPGEPGEVTEALFAYRN